ncbi:hypothetical protein [Phytomonospora endophytica]|uniref:Uncharacterized protein n=1 Tax=Phytomonospora endophytica TaxID=714109 RepID=A0A841FDC4_9ACTN|nr:hypothetical protein [Phytomonospora endophytica]MBB6033013.1 hypothetical protein [Phytomonospora endophytica]GIG65239.1 hypothetical protein Pen01_15340 [Phytomonospora endophytica]
MSAHHPFDPEVIAHNRKVRRYNLLGLWIAALSLIVTAVPVTVAILNNPPPEVTVAPPLYPSPAPPAWEFELAQTGVLISVGDGCGYFWIDFDQPFDGYYDSGFVPDMAQLPATADFIEGGCGEDQRAFPAPSVTAGESGTARTETAEGCAEVAAEATSPEWRFNVEPAPLPSIVQCIVTTTGTRLARATFTGLVDGAPSFDFTTWIRRE